MSRYKLYYALHKEEIRKKHRDRYLSNPEIYRKTGKKSRIKHKEELKQKRLKNRAKLNARHRQLYREKKLGIKPAKVRSVQVVDEYTSLYSQQDGVCAICGQPETLKIHNQTVSLSIDHDHSTGKIRGLLCSNCNHALGHFKDNPRILLSALDYLGGIRHEEKRGPSA